MVPSRKIAPCFLVTLLLALASAAVFAQPGIPVPNTSEIGGTQRGSILFFPLYTSGASGASTNNTKFNITNSSGTNSVAISLFFVANNGAPTSSTICLVRNQTASFLASDVDPGVEGYMVAVAVDFNGCPVNFNFLSGDAYVKMSTGHSGSYAAEAIAAISGTPAFCDPTSTAATLNFDGASYSKVPRVLGLDKIRSVADGNSTVLVVTRVGGSFLTGTSTIGTLSGTIYDDAGAGFDWKVLTTIGPQFKQILSDTFPATSPVFSSVIGAGRSGRLILNVPGLTVGLLGVCLNHNASTATNPLAYKGAHNLRHLSLNATASIVMPVRPPGC